MLISIYYLKADDIAVKSIKLFQPNNGPEFVVPETDISESDKFYSMMVQSTSGDMLRDVIIKLFVLSLEYNN